MSKPKKPTVYRPGKTQEDRMPTGERPRVQAAQRRRAAMQQMAALLAGKPPWSPPDEELD